MGWEQIRNHPDYEIFNAYDELNHTYPVRKIGNDLILKTSIYNNGYVYICLENNTKYRAHRIIAEHFIENDDPENKTEVDHIDHDKTNNRIENLRWVSRLQNQNNKNKYKDREIEFVQEIPDDVIVVNQYGKYHFNGYFFANDVFYKDTGNGDFRIVPWYYKKSTNNYTVQLTDENTIARTISKNVFYRLYGLD